MRISDWSSDVCSSDLARSKAGGRSSIGASGHRQQRVALIDEHRELARVAGAGDAFHRSIEARTRRLADRVARLREADHIVLPAPGVEGSSTAHAASSGDMKGDVWGHSGGATGVTRG